MLALLAAGAPFDHPEQAPLVYATTSNAKTETAALTIIDELLRRGADPNGKYFDQPAIVHAAWSGTPAVVRRLLRAGANPNLLFTFD